MTNQRLFSLHAWKDCHVHGLNSCCMRSMHVDFFVETFPPDCMVNGGNIDALLGSHIHIATVSTVGFPGVPVVDNQR